MHGALAGRPFVSPGDEKLCHRELTIALSRQKLLFERLSWSLTFSVVSLADVQEDTCRVLGCMVRSLDVHSRGLGIINYGFDPVNSHGPEQWTRGQPTQSNPSVFMRIFFCTSSRMASEDLSACVGSLGQKNLKGRLLVCPLAHLACASSLSRPALPQLSQTHLFSCGFFFARAHAWLAKTCPRAWVHWVKKP